MKQKFNPIDDPKRTEDYIVFGEDSYRVYDSKGKTAGTGDLGMGKLLTENGFEVDEMEGNVERTYWQIKARRKG